MLLRNILVPLLVIACLPLVAGEAGGGRGGRTGGGGFDLTRMLGADISGQGFDELAASTAPEDQQQAARVAMAERIRLLLEATRMRAQEHSTVITARQTAEAALTAYLDGLAKVAGVQALDEKRAAAETAMQDANRDERRTTWEELNQLTQEREALISGDATVKELKEKLAVAEFAYVAALKAVLAGDAVYTTLLAEKAVLDRATALEQQERATRRMRDFQDRMQRGGRGGRGGDTGADKPAEQPKPEGAKDF